ncbi:MAG: helix-turn-helix transcriptional regulator [Bacteroidia bacterium]|nr:helix-turn-helix transcriptional regulator [Bacteroidia bacterium]
MFNLYEKIKENPDFYRQLRVGDSLITLFNCLLQNKYEDAWSHYNYFVYVVDGRKTWHTSEGTYDLKKGNCAFVRKGACIVEQFFEKGSCFIFFFMPDEFIRESLQHKTVAQTSSITKSDPIIAISDNAMVQAFFSSMMHYFDSNREPDQALLELKFKELVLTLADDTSNTSLRDYFHSLVNQPRVINLQQVMEENFCFNLKLEEFARLSARSLAAFKRDFENIFRTSPGKWLLEKRLNHAAQLLSKKGKTVAEASFESGFESASHFSRAFRKRFGTAPTNLKHQSLSEL